MSGLESILDKPISREEDRYSMTHDELLRLFRRTGGRPFEMAFAAFRYGFDKGRRCERKCPAKKKPQKKASSTPTDQSETLNAQNTTGTGCLPSVYPIPAHLTREEA